MRFVYTGLFLSLCLVGFAQNGDAPDFRSKKDMFSRIVEKDIRSDVASFSFGGLDESVGKLPLQTIPITAATYNSISFAGNNIKVTVTSAPFDATKHKVGYYDKTVTKIDNKPYYGDYGKVPKTYVDKVTVTIGTDTIVVPPIACNDLCNPILSISERGVQKSSNKVYLSADGRKIYVYMLKEEAGGSYEVTWVIADKKYYRRVVDFGFLK